jgi:hypothetical protein
MSHLLSFKDYSNTYQTKLKTDEDIGREYIYNDMNAVVYQVKDFNSGI